MSWIRTNPLRQSFSRNSGGGSFNTSTSMSTRPIDSATDFDPQACYTSFCKHWQQAYEIILRSTSGTSGGKAADHQPVATHDDVLTVVNHLDHMVTLLLVELHHCNKISLPSPAATTTTQVSPLQSQPSAPCLEFLLSETLLNKLFEWGRSTGRYKHAVLLEQLKLYELLVSHSRHQLLVHEPFLRPLLKILGSCQGEIFPPDIAKRLVILLNQLCVVLMQNVHLLDLFFFSTTQQQEHGVTNFIIFSLLIPYVHREGSLGHQARDALLLCMALSQKNSNIGIYIAKYSSMCPVLVTGLGGLYSSLPTTIDIATNDWYRITPDDVADIQALTLFMNSLEFCNAVVQVAHPLIKQQLLDFMYQGFLVPVLGSTLIQIFNGSHLQTNIESQISAMAYLDLMLRSMTEPGLLRIFVRFLLDDGKFDGQRMLDILIERINATDSRLCMVTMSLFDTILSLHCEDLMLELLLKYLLPCQHVPISHRYKVNQVAPFAVASSQFLDLSPEVMKLATNSATLEWSAGDNNGGPVGMAGSVSSSPQHGMASKTIGANWNHYGLHMSDSLYGNYHAYLFDAKTKIGNCKAACQERWSTMYSYQKQKSAGKLRGGAFANSGGYHTIELMREFLEEFGDFGKAPSVGHGKASGGSAISNGSAAEETSLNSLGEGSSSGYESFRNRLDDEEAAHNSSEDCGSGGGMKLREVWKISQNKCDSLTVYDIDLSEDLFTQGTVYLGPFLNSIWGKLQTFTSNCLYVNLHLTGVITRLAWYPLPILQSILLRTDIATTSDTPSFYQVLKILKQQIDAELLSTDESLEVIDGARTFLVDRENRLLNTRKTAIDAKVVKSEFGKSSASQMVTANISATTPPQLTAGSSYDPFRRTENGRKSIRQSFSSIFKRPGSSASSGIAQQLKAFFTGSSSTSASNNGQSNSSSNSIPLKEGGQEPTSMDSVSSLNSGMSTTSSERMKDLAVCAVLLDEWLKELSAVAQEQMVMMLMDGAPSTQQNTQPPAMPVNSQLRTIEQRVPEIHGGSFHRMG